MTTPGNYPYDRLSQLWGGVQGDVQQGTASEDMRALASAQAQAMDGETYRRLLASQRPGHGAQVPIAESPAGAGAGKPTEAGPAVGLGYSVAPALSEAQHAAYQMPSGADDLVGGFGFVGGRAEPPVRRHVDVTNLGDSLFFAAGPDGRAPFAVSPLRRPGLLARLRERLTRGRR